MIDRRFGKLTVIAEAPISRRGGKTRTMWLVRCDCGTERAMSQDVLRKRVGCGCTRSKAPGESGAHALFVRYRATAARRGLAFEIDEVTLRRLTSSPCRYCGALPSSKAIAGPLTRASAKLSAYTYNGIDRVDNTRGYVAGNCAPCCKVCNKAKDRMTIAEFFLWISTVHSRLSQLLTIDHPDA